MPTLIESDHKPLHLDTNEKSLIFIDWSKKPGITLARIFSHAAFWGTDLLHPGQLVIFDRTRRTCDYRITRLRARNDSTAVVELIAFNAKGKPQTTTDTFFPIVTQVLITRIDDSLLATLPLSTPVQPKITEICTAYATRKRDVALAWIKELFCMGDPANDDTPR